MSASQTLLNKRETQTLPLIISSRFKHVKAGAQSYVENKIY